MINKISYYDLLTRITTNTQPKTIIVRVDEKKYSYDWNPLFHDYQCEDSSFTVLEKLCGINTLSESEMFTDELGIEYYEDPLTPFEKNWLKNYIEPFREKIDFIEKRERGDDEVKAVWIMVYCEGEDYGSTPLLPEDMFKGLEVNTGYTLEDLEL